jgi:hypothetical protein
LLPNATLINRRCSNDSTPQIPVSDFLFGFTMPGMVTKNSAAARA